MSTAKERIHKEEVLATRADAARRLRELADLVEAGGVDLGIRPVDVPELVTLEIDIVRKQQVNMATYEIETEIHWSERAAPTPAPDEAAEPIEELTSGSVD